MNRRTRIFIDDIKDLLKRIYKWFKSPVFRVHVFKIIAALLSFTLVASLYMVHVIYADEYVAFNAITTTANLSREVPRGVIYDRHMVPLVTNNSVGVITYRHLPNTPVPHMRVVAEALAGLIEIDDLENALTERDEQDLFIQLYPDEARDLVPVADRQGVSNEEFNALMIDRIEEEHLERLTEDDRRAHAIFLRMYQGAGMTTNIIKENPTEEEIARVIENLVHLPGIDVGTDWVREYPSDISRDFFGRVSTHQQGIPREHESYFLSQGYAANARVGTSQLERSMQSYLSGFQYRYFVDDGDVTLLSEGLPGFHISLNLDAELQLMIEGIVADHLLNARTRFSARYLDEAYVVISDPRTGAVLAMVGVVLSVDDNGVLEATMNPLGTIHRATTLGSAVKGATLMAGYYTNTTQVGQFRHDTPILIQASNPIGSWRNMGWISEMTAISQSSNVYFFRQSMDLAGVHHVPNGPILNWTNDNPVWDIYRDFFGQLGLGTRTGIELYESVGFRAERDFSNLLFFSIGQADTYTAMQMAQFGSVMATRGDRMQMQLIRNIYMPGNEGESMQLVRAFQPNLLNQVALTDAQWDNIQNSHRSVVTTGTARTVFEGVDFRPAGKTGTAEDYRRDEDGRIIQPLTPIYHRTFVAYAPFENPEIVVSVVTPQVQVAGSVETNLAAIIAREVMQAYFDLQADRADGR